MTDKKSVRSIRIRKRLNDWLLGIVIVLVLLALLGGWVAFQTHQNPETVVEEENVATWEERSSVSHYADVERANPVFEHNTTLSNQPHYFTELSPAVSGEYIYSYSATDGGELDVTLETMLQIQATDGDGNPYWQRTESLNQTQVTALSPDETATVWFELNVSQAVAEVERIQSTLATSIGTPEITILADARISGTVNNEQVTDQHREPITVDQDDGIYSIEASEGIQESYQQTRPVESQKTYGPVRMYGPFGLIFFSVVPLIALSVLKYQGRLVPTDQELTALEQHQQRNEFEDWISRGRIPAETLPGSAIELESLTDLVDVAIDTNNRVIEDTETGVFVVIGEERYYIVSPHGRDSMGLRYLLQYGENGHAGSSKSQTSDTNDADDPNSETTVPKNSESDKVTDEQ